MKITKLMHSSNMGFLRLALLLSLAWTPAFAQDSPHEGHGNVPATLIQKVRAATQQFLDVNNAGPDYAPAFGCVAGPDHGAMGIHYVNGEFVGDGEIRVDQPEALIYEPVGNKRVLVGVEYIVDAATYLKNHSNQTPELEGQLFNFVDKPNRFQLEPFFELHVWA